VLAFLGVPLGTSGPTGLFLRLLFSLQYGQLNMMYKTESDYIYYRAEYPLLSNQIII
jgi:hypothetical protein